VYKLKTIALSGAFVLSIFAAAIAQRKASRRLKARI
jgi:hypothetical protein